LGIEKQKAAWIPRREKTFGYREAKSSMNTQNGEKPLGIEKQRLRKSPKKAKAIGMEEIKAGYEHRLLFSKVNCGSFPQ